MPRTARIRVIDTMALALSFGAIGVAQSPATRTLVCTRNERAIGNETITVTHSATGTMVKMDVHLQVKMLKISFYRFDQTSTETWSKDRLDDLTSDTTDNGHHHTLRVHRDGSALKVSADNANSAIDAASLPATLWYEPHFQEAILIHNVDGHVLHVKAQKLGEEKLTIGSGAVNAIHYRLSGDLTDDLWFDADGIVVQRRSTASDHSVLQFTMK